MNQFDQILEQQLHKLKKALAHLDYSYQKIEHLGVDPDSLSESELADWEAYSARFSRVVELFLGRYLRTKILREDPGFEGTLRDYVNKAEKIALIQDAETWMALRGLRNITAHEYSESDLKTFFSMLRQAYPTLKSIQT